MTTGKKRRTRRKRRSDKANLKHPGAKPRHTLKSGRTGQAHTKKLRSRNPRRSERTPGKEIASGKHVHFTFRVFELEVNHE